MTDPYQFLRQVSLFAALSPEALQALAAGVAHLMLADGEELFAEGTPGDRAYVIQRGNLEIVKASGNQEVLLAVKGRGAVIGEMALLEDAPRSASVRARGETTLLAIEREALDELLARSPSAARALLQTVTRRLRHTQSQLQLTEKMAQLGALTAGVAHELNNPAAAMRRSAALLDEGVQAFVRASVELTRHDVTPEAVARHAAQPGNAEALDALARSDREMEVETWLEARGVEEPWEIASGLVDAGYDTDRLHAIGAKYDAPALNAVLAWVAARAQVEALLGEIDAGAAQISKIVEGLKSYSYLDRAPVQMVDIHGGLESALAVLRHRLEKGIAVDRHFAPDLPRVYGYGRELNQVWTNLLENAADAMDDEGTITLRTRREDDWIVVEIEDDGPGIPEAVQSRVFEPFFTTKAPGAGSGLGLNISYNAVIYKHNGAIELESQPGMTRFTVWLPLNFEDAGPLPAGVSAPASADGADAMLQ